MGATGYVSCFCFVIVHIHSSCYIIIMLRNHVLFCAPVLHLTGGTKDQERWPQQNPGQGLQGIAVEIMHDAILCDTC